MARHSANTSIRLSEIGKRDLDRVMLSPNAPLIEALRRIDEGGRAIVFVCDARRRVIGTLADGDVRRAILAGAALDSRCVPDVMQREFASVSPDAGRAEVLDMMRARGIDQVPVVDAAGRLGGVHSLHDLLGARERTNWAVIMAGGKGTRLGPMTESVPKPMITVAGRPILERLVLHLFSFGIRRIFLAVNHLASVIEDHFGDGARFGCRIEYLREDEPLGTGGALSLLPALPTVPLLVMNGDLVTQLDVERLLWFHAKGRYAATFGVRPYSVSIPYGVATVRRSQLVELREKPTERMLINAGIYLLDPRVVRMVPRGRDYPITELFDRCLRKKMKVGAHLIEDEWVDVGRHEELRRARGQI